MLMNKNKSGRHWPFAICMLKSNWCKAIFAFSLAGSYFLIPADVWAGEHRLLAFVFMLTFSISLTCIVRNIKERVKAAVAYQTSIISLIATILGLSAFQVCGLGAPICGASVGAGLLAVFFPGFMVNFITDYSLTIIWLSIAAQLIGLWFLKCLRPTQTPASKHFSAQPKN